MDNYTEILEKYITWIKDNTSIRAVSLDDTAEVTTPFLDRHNDHLQIYIQKLGDTYKLTDGGYTIQDLELSGLEINTPKREHVVKTTLNGYGIKIDENSKELFVNSNISNIGQKKHYLLQAILAINDMYTMSSESVYSLFKEDVELYLKSHNIFFSKDIKISGKTGFDHNIDFIIPSTSSKPERLVKTINNPSKENVMSAIFSFNDISAIREVRTKNFVVYNNEIRETTSEVKSALDNYEIEAVPWSNKNHLVEELALA